LRADHPGSRVKFARRSTVADLLVDEEGQISRLCMKTGALLGIGTRTIEIPDGAFIVLRVRLSSRFLPSSAGARRGQVNPEQREVGYNRGIHLVLSVGMFAYRHCRPVRGTSSGECGF
jgi:hypothetical protein